MNIDWKSIKTAPKDETEIRLRFANGFEATGFWSIDSEDWYANEADSNSLTEHRGQPIEWTESSAQVRSFWVTVRRNDGTPKFYAGTDDREEAGAIAAERNAKELDLRQRRAAEHGRALEQCDQYTYEVVER